MVFKYSKVVPEIPWLLLKNILRWSIQKRDTRVTTRCKNHNWNNSICDKVMYKTDNEIRNYEMLSKDSMFIREIARIVEQYLNDPDIQWIILNFGERETEEARKQGRRSKQPETRSTVAGMSSFFEFLIKAILCMQVKNFMTVYLMARGLQLTLFRFGINAQDARYKDTCFYWKKEGVVQAVVPFLSHEWQSWMDPPPVFFFNLKRDRKLNL